VCAQKFGRARMWHAVCTSRIDAKSAVTTLACKCSIERAITQINKILTSTPILHTHLLKTNGRCVCVCRVEQKETAAAHGVQNSSLPMIITTVNLFSLLPRRERCYRSFSLARESPNLCWVRRSVRRVKDHRSPDARHVHTARRVRPAAVRRRNCTLRL
jgi:hypothetical protein